jgi:hypothetical protein
VHWRGMAGCQLALPGYGSLRFLVGGQGLVRWIAMLAEIATIEAKVVPCGLGSLTFASVAC